MVRQGQDRDARAPGDGLDDQDGRVAGEWPLAPAQEALWLHQQRHPESTAYNLTVGVRIAGRADVGNVQAALQAVVDRHDPLRSVYREVDGSGRRVVLAAMPLAMRTIKLDPAPSDADWVGDPRVSTAIDEIAKRPYRLGSETLRATLVTNGADRHLLIVGVHHLTADGWSAKQFVVEGVANFQQLVDGARPSVEPPSSSYGAWASAERVRLEDRDAAASCEYWKDVLADAPIESRIPASPIAPQRSLSGARIEVAIPGPIRDRLRQLAREQGVSMFTVILAGSQAVLSRLAAQEDVVVAVPYANRAEGTRETIGLFVNTLPIGAHIGTTTTFRELLGEVGIALRAAREYGWLPIDRIVKASGAATTGPDDSLCQLMVNYLGHALPPVELGGMEFEYLGTFDTGESQYELSIHLEDVPERMRGFVEYRTGFHAEEDVKRFWQRLLAHLEAATASPDHPLSELPILGSGDHAELHRFEQGQERDYEIEIPLDAHIARRVRDTPEAIALSDSTGRLSYGEMWDRVRELGAVLRQHGISRGDVVLVCAERSRRLPIALLAIMRAGAAYCPIDPEQPLARLRHVVAQARPVAVVADAAQRQLIEDLLGEDRSIERIALDAEPPAPSGSAAMNGDREFDPDDPAYVIFTSGSTGRPKGVLVPHRGVVNRLLWMQEKFGLSSDDTVLQKTPYTFDVSVWEFFWPLMAGARLHLADPGAHRDPERLAEVIRAEGVTTIHFVPTMLGAFVQEPAATSCLSLRRVICSGEALPGATMERALEALPWASLWNLYGPTEASIDVTCWRCRPQAVGGPVSIGRPIANVACYVLDEQMAKVPVGTPGELYLGGIQVALGYVGQPGLTAERFLESDFASGPLYRTGDLVRWRPDGLLDYLGRVDRQVKIRGVRIELGEIEEVLRGMAEVADATVVVRSDIGPTQALVAYVVPDGPPCDEVELRVRLARLLPDYMVPRRVMALERLPVTSSGKVDQAALPRPVAKADSESRGLSSEERLLATLWTRALGIEDGPSIGPADSYFALGGDSMTSVMLRAEARRAGFELSLRDILSRPVLADMAKALQAGSPEADDTGSTPLVGPGQLPPEVEDAYPLSAMQAGMIFHSEFGETSSSYQVTFDLELELPWDPIAFQAAVDDLVERHEILRTSFDLHSYNEPMQLVHRRARLPVRIVEAHTRSAEARQLECDRIFDAEQVRSFDLDAPPALRLTLVRTGEAVAHLFMAFHDSIFDGWSGAVFMTELCSRFVAKLEGDGPGDPPKERLATRYRDYIVLERAAAADDESLEYWLDLCRDAPFVRLPRREQVIGTGRSRDVELAVPDEVVERLRSVANDRNVPLKALLVTAYLAAVGRLAGERDVLAGLVSGGRPETPDSDGMLGQFLNTVPIRARLAGSWTSLASKVHLAELEGIPFRRMPLLALMKQGDGRIPFETAFNLVHFHVYKKLATQARVDLRSARFTDPFHFPLTVNARLHPLDGSLAIVVNHNESEVDVDQAERLGEDVIEALAAIAAEPEASCAGWLGGRVPMPAPLGVRDEASSVRGIAMPSVAEEAGTLDPGVSRAISELWRTVLEIDSAELDQDFFVEGGDSILTVQLAARARSMGFRLRPRDVFECSTLRELIKRVEVGTDHLAVGGRGLSESQVTDPGLIAMAMSHQGGHECSVLCFELLAGLDRDGVVASTEALLRRHQLLRSIAIEEGPGRWIRRIVEVDTDKLPLVWSESREVSGWLGELMETVDLLRGPSTLIGHLSNPDGSTFIAFVADHGSADLASLQLAAGDFLDAYAQYAAVGAIMLDPAPGLAELEQLRLPHYDADGLYRSTPAPWSPIVASLDGADRVEAVALSVEASDALQRAASAAGAGIHHLILVAIARAIEAASDLDPGSPVVVDLMDLGRTAVGIEAELVAPLAHPVPVSVPSGLDGAAFEVARELAEASARRDVHRSRVRELVEIAVEDKRGTDAPGVLLNHLGRVDPDVPWPLKRVIGWDVQLRGRPRRASYAVEVRSKIIGGTLSLEVASPHTASSAGQLRVFARALHDALSEVALEATGASISVVEPDSVGGVL